MMIIMNMNIKLAGIPEQIMDGAIKAGLAKTKTDVLMLGLMELDHKYKLLEQMEDEEDLRDARRIMAEIKSGKRKVISAREFERRTGLHLMGGVLKGMEKKPVREVVKELKKGWD